MIEFTGERLIPGQVNPDLWAEHISRYRYAQLLSSAKAILDLGCGAGYGTALLAQNAHTAHGIDIAPEAIAFATAHYHSINTTFSVASATQPPFDDASFDLITAFEVIEHLEHWDRMLLEAKRLLTPDGIFLVSTPNKAYYTESRGSAGANPYHVHEFEYDEFMQALTRHFPQTNILFQNRVDAFTFLHPHSNQQATAYFENSDPPADPTQAYFFFAACARNPILYLPPFVSIPRASNLLRERERHIHGLMETLADQRTQFTTLQHIHGELETHLKQQNAWAQTLDQELKDARSKLADLQAELEKQNTWALRLDHDLAAARQAHETLQAEFDQRTAWALQLNRDLTASQTRASQLQARADAYRASRWVRLGRKLHLGPAFPDGE